MYLHITLLKSTIFRTITDESTGAVRSIGLFGRSITDLKTSLASIKANGFFNTIFNTSTIDVSKVTAYNAAIANGTNAQEALAQASVGTNKATINLIKSANGATVSTEALTAAQKASTVASKALSIGMKALSVAMNVGIALLIPVIIKGIDKLITTKAELAEKAEEVTSKFREQKEELTGNRAKFDELAVKYEKLSKGVNALGENLSLTSDEYEEYHNVVNQIASMFPSWVKGWDEQGNAILDVKGNVEELTQAYNDAIIAANNVILKDAKTVFGDFKNDMEENDESNFKGNEFTTYSYKALKNIINSNDLDSAIQQYAATGTTNMVQIVQALKDAGLEQNWNESGHDFIKRACQENSEIVRSIVGDFEQKLETETAGVKSVAEAYIGNAFLGDYAKVDKSIQGIVKQMVSGFDAEFYSQFDSVDELYKYLKGMLDDFANLNKEDTANIKTFFEIQTKFNNGEITVAEYQEKLSSFLSAIDGLPEETQKAIKLLFGITTNDDGTTSSDVDTMVKNVKDKFKGKFDKEIGQLKLDELEILADLDISPEGIESWSEVETLIANAGKEANKMTVSLSETADKIKELHSFIKELDDDGLSPDSIEKIISDYTELIGYIGDEARLRTELKKKIAEEENKYKQALRNKVMASSSFAELVISKNETLFKELGLAYDKDTQKFVLEQRRKAAAAVTYAHEAGNAWAQIYADEQVLAAPDYTSDLHNSGKNSKYRDKDGNWHFETFSGGKLLTHTYEAGSSMAKILDSQRELANITNFDIDFGDDSSSSKDSYEDLYDEFLETLEQEVEDIDDSISRINTKLEHAIKTGNAEQIQILSKELDDAYKQKKELLESKANEARTQLALIMEEIYAIAPQLTGKSINEITPYEIEVISMSLGDASGKWDSITKSAQNYYETISEWSDEWWKNEEDKLNSTEEYYNTILDEIDRYTERIEKSRQEEIDALDKQITKEEALLKIKQGEYDTTNKLKEAQKDIDKEIANSRNSKQYLSEFEYDKIFGEADYEFLSGEIEEITNDIAGISAKFYEQIEDAYANDQLYLVEAITAEYERQLASKERELEIAKAQVDLEKKRLTLENAKNERNIKQYSENGITWVADQEKVKQATEDFIDAQATIKNLQEKSAQQMELDRRQANIDMLNSQKESIEYQNELMNKATENLKLAIEDVTDPLADFSTLIQTLITDINKSISDTAKSVNSNVNKISGNASSSNGSRSNIGSSGGSGGTGRVSKTDNYDGTHNYTDSSNIISINGQLYDRSQSDSNGLAKPIKNATEVLYDSGGIASGKGLMLKGVDEEETVLPPWLTKQVLTPEYNENFSKLLENMQMVSLFNPSDFVVQPQIANLPTRDISQPTSISKTWTGNMYVEGGDPNEVLKALNDAFDRNMP